MEAKDKRKWTALAIIFNSMSCLWFIWIEYDKLKKITTAPNNVYDSWSDALHFWLPSKKLNQNHKAYHEVIYVTCGALKEIPNEFKDI